MSKTKTHILLAEDDENLGMLLTEYLTSEGFDVTLCPDGEIAVKTFNKDEFDLCLLDVMMPKMDGFSVAKVIRKQSKKLPIIFITARFLKQDKQKGYGLGADDYITKPFDEEELLWKIKAILRRTPVGKKQENVPIVTIGEYHFDFQNQLLTHQTDSRRITEKECEIVHYISERRNQVIKREEMLEEIWGENDYFSGRSLDVFITKIRKYLKSDPTLSIENVYGVGFIFNAPEKSVLADH